MRVWVWGCLVVAACGSGAGNDGGGAGDGDADTDGDTDADVGLLCDEPLCRGDLTGAWDLHAACVDEFEIEDEQSDCPEWVCRIVEADASGSFVFGADGRAAVSVTTTTRSECHVPLARIIHELA